MGKIPFKKYFQNKKELTKYYENIYDKNTSKKFYLLTVSLLHHHRRHDHVWLGTAYKGDGVGLDEMIRLPAAALPGTSFTSCLEPLKLRLYNAIKKICLL